MEFAVRHIGVYSRADDRWQLRGLADDADPTAKRWMKLGRCLLPVESQFGKQDENTTGHLALSLSR